MKPGGLRQSSPSSTYGDITGELWQISKAVGKAAVACLSAFGFLTGKQMRNLG